MLDWITMSGGLLLTTATAALVTAFWASAAAKDQEISEEQKLQRHRLGVAGVAVGAIAALAWMYSISAPGAMRRAVLEGAPVDEILAYCDETASYAKRSRCYETEVLRHKDAVELRDWLQERAVDRTNATSPEAVDADRIERPTETQG